MNRVHLALSAAAVVASVPAEHRAKVISDYEAQETKHIERRVDSKPDRVPEVVRRQEAEKEIASEVAQLKDLYQV